MVHLIVILASKQNPLNRCTREYGLTCYCILQICHKANISFNILSVPLPYYNRVLFNTHIFYNTGIPQKFVNMDFCVAFRQWPNDHSFTVETV